MNSESNKTIDELTSEALITRIPVRVFIGMIAILGIIGNCHVLFLYYARFKKTTYRCFVLSLAVIDLIGCCVSMPFEIVDESLPYSYSDTMSCKIFRFVNFCVALSCAFTLVLIASERYRKICKPYGIQMTEIRAKKYVIIVIISTVVVSLPVLYIYGTKTIELNEVQTGKECTWGDHMKDRPLFGYAYAGFLTLLIIVCMISLSVIYAIIGYSLKRHERRIRARLDKNHCDSVKLNRSFCSSSDLFKHKFSSQSKHVSRLSHSCEELPDPNTRQQDDISKSLFKRIPKKNFFKSETKTVDIEKKQADVSNVRDQKLGSRNVNGINQHDNDGQKETNQLAENVNRKVTQLEIVPDTCGVKNPREFDLKNLKKMFPVERKEKKITKVLVAITLLFIASFFPYVIIVIVYITNPDYENNMTSSQLTFYLIAFRLYNINNMANPIFYFFFDVKFREEVFSLYRSFWKTEQEKSLKSAT